MSAGLSTDAPHQRARGALLIGAKCRDGRAVLDRLRQEGTLKARFPRETPDGRLHAVTLNSAGGVVAGDVLSTAVAAGPDAAIVVAAQAAERFYRALPGSPPARVDNRVTVEAGATVEWLPQETILFDGAALDRRMDVTLAGDARLLLSEMLVFGRIAMAERVRRLALDDLIAVRRAGRLVLHDRVRIAGDAEAVLAARATGAGARAVATLLLVAPDAEARVDALRAGLIDDMGGVEAGVSAWDGMLLARLVSPDPAALRRRVIAGLAILRDFRTMPRVWSC